MTAGTSTAHGEVAWVPRPGDGNTAVRAGYWWDAIRIHLPTGCRALAALHAESGARPGPVIADPRGPRPCVYVLVPPTTAARWDAPASRALGDSSYVVVPPAGRVAPPGLHWMVPPDVDRPLTAPGELRDALRAVVGASG